MIDVTLTIYLLHTYPKEKQDPFSLYSLYKSSGLVININSMINALKKEK